MQNKLYNTIFLTTQRQIQSQSPSRDHGPPLDFLKLHEVPEKGRTPGKVQTPSKPRSWMLPAPWPTSFIN